MIDISLDKRVDDIVKDYPQAMDFFNEKNIDYCCHGADSLRDSIKRAQVKEGDFLKDLRTHIEANKQTSKNLSHFESLNTSKMAYDIEISHHQVERKLLDQIDDLFKKILLVHYQNHGNEIKEAYRVFLEIKLNLLAHLAKEEKVVFPKFNENFSKEDLAYIEDLEDEHRAMGDLVEELKDKTNNFKAPEDACNTYRHTFLKLKDLTEDIYLHIFKENSILFKKIRKSFN